MFSTGLKEARQRAADLKAEIAQLKKTRAALGEGAVAAGRGLLETERTEFVALGGKLNQVEKDLAENDKALQAAEAANEADRAYRGPTDDSDQMAADAVARRAGIIKGEPWAPAGVSAITKPTGRCFHDLFPQAAAQMDGWESPGEYLACIGRGLHDRRLRAESMSGSGGSAGGFAVPVQMFGQWLDSSLESEIVRSRCTTWPMATSELDVPALDDLSRSGGTIAGLELRFEAELATMEPQVAKLRFLKLKARRGAIFLEASNELLRDAPSFDVNLSAALIKVLAFGLDNRFLFGSGADGPLGALVSPAAIIVARTTASKVKYGDLTSMFSRLTPGSVARSVWVCAPSTIPQLTELAVPVGTAGSHVAVMTSNDGQFTILTRPVLISEKAKPLGTQSDVSLADFSAYAIGLRSEATLEKSQHVGFARNVETWRLQIRVDGQPTISEPITPLNGATMSPFVTLGDPA